MLPPRDKYGAVAKHGPFYAIKQETPSRNGKASPAVVSVSGFSSGSCPVAKHLCETPGQRVFALFPLAVLANVTGMRCALTAA